MTAIYLGFLGFIFFAGVAFTWNTGLWSNTITLLLIVFSGLISFNYYGQLATLLDEKVSDGQFTYFWDFLSLWIIYCATFGVLRLITSQLSGISVRFRKPIDPIGGKIVGVLVAYLTAGFASATMHTAPVPSDFLGGILYAESAEDLDVKLTRPDLVWLRFVGSAMTTIMPTPAGNALEARMDKAAGRSNYRPLVSKGGTYAALYARLFAIHYQLRREQLDAASGLKVERTASNPG